jgi:GNAT superfamily N-acetyltransferase
MVNHDSAVENVLAPMDSESVRIERADPRHLPTVSSLAEIWQLGRRPDEISHQGFLVADWKLGDYETFLREAEHFYVALIDERVAGFIIGYTEQHANLDVMLNREIRAHLDEYLNCEQVCVDPGWSRRGVGTRLWSHLIQRREWRPVVVEIVSSPPNVPSSSFHQKLGFQPFIEVHRPNGLATTVWMYQNNDGLAGAQSPVGGRSA